MKKVIFGIFVGMLIIASSYTVYGEFTNNKINYANESITNNGNWNELVKIKASDNEPLSFFGSSLAIYQDYAILGAHGDADNGDFSGAAYIFKRKGTNWIEQTKLLASDGVTNDMFGHTVSMDEDYAIIGAPAADGPGYAYIFKNTGTTWIEEQKLTASDGEIWDEFGYSVSIDGEYAIIGAQFDDDIGSAYIFKLTGSTWVEQQKLTASDGELWDVFGMSVAINDEYAIIGGFGDEDYTGAAYIFKRTGSTWSEEAKLTASDIVPGERFGISVAIESEYAFVSSTHDDNFKGAVYVFKRNGTVWTEEQKLTASDGSYTDNFGISFSVDGDCLIIGAFDTSDNGVHSGSAYVFYNDGSNWIESQKLLPSDGAAHDQFGLGVSLDGDYALIGAYAEDDFTGSAYVFGTHQPPTAPEIDGPTQGSDGVELCWTFHSDDPDGDQIKYIIDWGDDTTTETECNDPCTPVEACHTYEKKGTYIINSRAMDCPDGLDSDNSTFEVNIPRQRSIRNLLLIRLFELLKIVFPVY
jgi:hypothetical protein